MNRNDTTDFRSSPPLKFEPQGLITTPALWVLANAAQQRLRRSGKEKDPLEWETTALWEDLYNKTLMRGLELCHNSQQPPTDHAAQRCDIVTRYVDQVSGHRRTLIFTEAKRAGEANNDGARAMEDQVFGYCSLYLKADGSWPYVFACTVVATKIRFFLVTIEKRINELSDRAKALRWETYSPGMKGSTKVRWCPLPDAQGKLMTEKLGDSSAYLNAFDDYDAGRILDKFSYIVEESSHPALISRPATSPSRAGSSPPVARQQDSPGYQSSRGRSPSSQEHLSSPLTHRTRLPSTDSRAQSRAPTGRRSESPRYTAQTVPSVERLAYDAGYESLRGRSPSGQGQSGSSLVPQPRIPSTDSRARSRASTDRRSESPREVSQTGPETYRQRNPLPQDRQSTYAEAILTLDQPGSNETTSTYVVTPLDRRRYGDVGYKVKFHDIVHTRHRESRKDQFIVKFNRPSNPALEGVQFLVSNPREVFDRWRYQEAPRRR